MENAENPVKSRRNFYKNVMNSKKTFKDLVKQMSELSEDQQGKLKGGFSAYSAPKAAVVNGTTVTVTVALGTTCTCTCPVN
jgi:hypothetical protein